MLLGPLLADELNDLQQLQPEDWPSIIPAFQYYTDNSFCIPLKISDNGKIIAVGATIIFKDTAWLAHVIVHPDYRNQGLGRRMVAALLDKTKEAGCQTVSLIATELGYHLYKKLGFEDDVDYLFWENNNPPEQGSLSKNISRFTALDERPLLALDRLVSGEERSKILTNKLKNAYVYKEKNCLRGFYLPDLGEGLIIADDDEAGIELLRYRGRSVNKTVLPATNEGGIKYLRENGFSENKRVKRMVYGKKLRWYPQKLYSRIDGNFG
ncbi:MAG TPA: GNAT family N-acetyltransferase [Bacillota bacterium]|nr:GNAT family N-acetyltransferase [Bacillota bacterium]